MKKLQKIKLINWYTFQNETINIQGNVLISGANGSGKSTLLDAVQFVLSAGNQKFNQAANEKCTRTVESYIRGKLNTEKKAFLREGDVTAYIALEFSNDTDSRIDIIGAVMEITTSSNLNKTFFKISGTEITDDLFIEDNAPKTLWNFKHKKNLEIEFFDIKREVQKMICSVLGLSGNKYFELLHRALSFKPIDNINDFVHTFLLPEDNINIENLTQNIEQLRSLIDIVETEEEKVSYLTKIEEIYQQYQELQHSLEQQQFLKDNIKQEKIKQKITELKDTKKQISLELEKFASQQNEYTNQREKVNQSRRMYRQENEKGEQTKIYDQLIDEEEAVKKAINAEEVLYKDYKKELGHEKNNLNSFPWSKKIEKIDLKDTISTKEILVEINNHLIKDKDALIKKEIELKTRKEEVDEKIAFTKSKIDLLKKKKIPYQEEVNNLIQEIKETLSAKYNVNIEVRPLCEYLEITSERWRKAIEGYLNNQRFDLIIDPLYFDEALEIYEAKKKAKKIHGVGLVNTKKYSQDLKKEEDTLAYFIKSANIYAERYATFILNKVVYCEKIEDLKQHKRAITETCMTYSNHVARQINPKVYEYYFIGKEAKVQQLKKYEQAFTLLKELKMKITPEYNETINKKSKLSNSAIPNLIYKLKVVENYNQLTNKYLYVKEQINNLKIDGLFNNIKEQIDKYNQEEETLTKKINNLTKDIIESEVKVKNIEEQLNELQEELLEKNINLEIPESWIQEFYKIIKDRKLIQVEKEIIEKEEKLKSKLIKYEREICLELNNYNSKFCFDEIASLENIRAYLDELTKIREYNLLEHKSSIQNFKEQCQTSFREDFISKLRDKIDTAKEEIKKLNKSLKKQNFGKEHYEFICTKSTDKDMGIYYDIITSGNNFNVHTLFEDTLTIEQYDHMEALFARITASHTTESTEKTIKEYTDYRRYMSYDIKVTNEDGDSYLFSSCAREKSGGEIQTPFYVIIAASFEQLLRNGRRNDAVGAIVLFDEAFNTMDESRINAMMRFYSNLNIQLLISVPPERIPSIATNVNTILIINSKSNYSTINEIGVEELIYE